MISSVFSVRELNKGTRETNDFGTQVLIQTLAVGEVTFWHDSILYLGRLKVNH